MHHMTGFLSKMTNTLAMHPKNFMKTVVILDRKQMRYAFILDRRNNSPVVQYFETIWQLKSILWANDNSRDMNLR